MVNKYLLVSVVLLITSVFIPFPCNQTVQAASESKIALKSYTFGDNQKFKVGFDGKAIIVQIRPRPGEGVFRFASWTLRDWRKNFKKINQFNTNKPLQKGQYVTFPFGSLNDNMQSLVLQTLFPNDTAEEEVWAHRVVFKGETISLIAGVFAKNSVSAINLIEYNELPNNGRNLYIGDVVNIPWNWIRKELNLKPVEVKPPLKVKLDQFGEPHAYYKIQKGESLYSSVVIRFTGRTLAEDVNRMAERLMKLNNIKDEHFILVGSEIKIPIEWLSEEFIITKSADIKEEKVIEKPDVETVKKGIPVHVIIDSGHGGKDPGAYYGSVKKRTVIFEDETVYDISLRLAELLKARNYQVHMTLEDPDQKKPIKNLATVKDADERILVNPPYKITHVRTGINMRIFLVNHIYDSLRRKKVPRKNILLISLHGDALHKSLSGATVYFPDARLRASVFRKRHKVYRARKEYRKELRYPVKENSKAAYNSKAYGNEVIKAFKNAGLKTHRSFAVRGYYYRKGAKTLPGILRYSKIPTSVLVEVGNLNNAADRAGLRKADFRQKIARALTNSIDAYYK